MYTKIGQPAGLGWRLNLANGKSMFAEAFVSKNTTLTSGATRNVQKYQVHKDEVYERHVVHRFTMSDVDDPDIYVAQPIYEWQQTEQGKWVMKNGHDPQYHMHMEPMTYGYVVTITAHITPKRWTEYCLRFPVIA
jgi:hypothetical protein